MTRLAAAELYLRNLPLGLPVAGESAWVFTNRNWRGDGTVPGIIYCAGKAAGAYNIIGAGFAQELAKRGYPVICGDLGDIPSQVGKLDGPGVWGCDAALTKMETLRTFLINVMGAKPGKIAVLGGSHGCAAAYAYARNYAANVSCVATVIGTADVEHIRANNIMSYQASIEGAPAYGSNANWQAARATHNPVEVAPWLAANGIPMLDYYAPDDPVCVLSTHQALKTAGGAMLTQVSLGNVGHSFTGVGPLAGPNAGPASSDIADWVQACIG